MNRLRGFTLLEVLITMVILAFGLLGLASLQSKMHVTEMESYQRAQAVLLLNDMFGRMNNNRANAASYVNAQEVGTAGLGDTTANGGSPCDPTAIAMGATRDRCEWGLALLGAAEAKGGSNVGAMIGARGCIQQLQARNDVDGACQAGVYRISIAWQGLTPTVVPAAALSCGAAGFPSPNEAYRRIVTTTVTIGVPGCV